MYITREATCCIWNKIKTIYEISLSHRPRSNEKYQYTFNCITKCLFERLAAWVFCDEIIKSSNLITNYFSWNSKMVIALVIAGTNIFLGAMIPVLQNAFRTFIDIAIQHSHAFDLYIHPLLNLVAIIFSISIVHALNAMLCKKLRDDLTFEFRGNLWETWNSTKACSRYPNTTAGKKINNPSLILSITVRNFCNNLINLANARLSTLSQFAGALRSLYLNSGWIELSLFGLTLTIPYLIVVCIIYAYGYNLISSWANKVFKKNVEDENIAQNKLNNEANKIKSQTELPLSRDTEPASYANINNCIHAINKRSLWPQFGLSFLNKINSEGSLVIGAIPQLIKGDIHPITVINSAYNFAFIAKQASWKRDNTEAIKTLEVYTEQVQSILDVFDELQSRNDDSIVVDFS